jgi:hypothetical protein
MVELKNDLSIILYTMPSLVSLSPEQEEFIKRIGSYDTVDVFRKMPVGFHRVQLEPVRECLYLLWDNGHVVSIDRDLCSLAAPNGQYLYWNNMDPGETFDQVCTRKYDDKMTWGDYMRANL